MAKAGRSPEADCLDLIARRARQPDPRRCLVAPSPELQDRIQEQVRRLRTRVVLRATNLVARENAAPGLNDGLIIPGTYFPVGTPLAVVRSAAADRAPLRGTLRVIVVLVGFSDQAVGESKQHFEELFFSTGVLPNGSVKEYFHEVAHGLISIDGEVVGPYTLANTMAFYANGDSGTGSALPNARTMAREAAIAADPQVDFGPYDNDGNGFVDAFIVVHAGPGAEVTGNPNHIWSHKWVLSGGEYNADTTKIYGYLTVPEDAKIGVCAHELGHLLFGWPDLYDIDNSSSGIGNWCLMAGGSWNGGGDVPAHASAWCKANQGWVSVVNQQSNQTVNVVDVKDSQSVYRLWKDGGPGSEYFLVENRQRNRYDAQLPGEGLLIWHVDESIQTNSNEAHYKVGLVQADGRKQLESGANRGDNADPYPGSANNTSFTATSTPNSSSYAGSRTCVAITSIGPAGPVMSARLAVRCRPVKQRKETLADKSRFAEKRFEKGASFEKRPEKPIIDKAATFDKPPLSEKTRDKTWDKSFEGGFGAGQFPGPQPGAAPAPNLWEVEARLAALEARLGVGQPFIGGELRPDLGDGGLLAEQDYEEAQKEMQEGAVDAKRLYDTKPQREM